MRLTSDSRLRMAPALSMATVFWAFPAAAQFTTEQELAFGLNAGQLAGDLNLLIAGAIIAVLLVASALIAYAAYGRWASGSLSAASFGMLVIRASVLVAIASIFLR